MNATQKINSSNEELFVENTVDMSDPDIVNIILVTEEGKTFNDAGNKLLEGMAQKRFSEPVQHFCHYQGAFLNEPEKLCDLIRKLNPERTLLYVPRTAEYGTCLEPTQQNAENTIAVLTEVHDDDPDETSFNIICQWFDYMDRRDGIKPLDEK